MTTSGVTPQAASTPAGSGGNTARLESIRPHLPREFVARLVEDVVVGSSAGTAPIHAPMTGEVIVELPQSGPGDVRHAFQKARAAQPAWAARPVGERAAVLRRFHDLLFDNEPHLLNLIQIETGKARLHAYEELAGSAAALRHYAAAAGGYLKDRRRPGILPGLTKVSEVRHPKGVVGLITPWNYPLALVVMDIAPALVAGNAVVHKPDNATTLTALYARQFAIRAGLPQDVWQIVTGEGPVTGPAVVDHADYVAFTGSTRTGRQVAQQAAGRLVGCSLELGGKNAMIVRPDADLDLVVDGATFGAFGTAGQRCTSTSRLLVHPDIAGELVERVVQRARALVLGDPLAPGTDVGPVINHQSAERIVAMIATARAEGAEVACGGARRDDVEGCPGGVFVEPTVLVGVKPDHRIAREEAFGPVLAVIEVADLDEAVDVVNSVEYGLSAAIYTRDINDALRAVDRIDAGIVYVNAPTIGAEIPLPFGGTKHTGNGFREAGARGIEQFSQLKTVYVDYSGRLQRAQIDNREDLA
jgi:succinate-semialdehyde dehydrogenase/glutarate-semialdehyde dehydrogenase